MSKYTVAVDFDGVIHAYTSPWVAADVIPDGPVPGAIEWLNHIGKSFKVVIHTTRGQSPAGQWAVQAWLRGYGCTLDNVTVTNIKVPALVYIDDRAWRFEGQFPSHGEILRAVPWNKKEKT